MIKKEFKNQLHTRIAFVCFLCIVLCSFVIGRVAYLQFSGAEKRETYKKLGNEVINGIRGDIRADDGQPLATTVTLYSPYWDSKRVSTPIFNKHIAKLAHKLDSLYPAKSAVKSFRKRLTEIHTKQKQTPIAKSIGPAELNVLKELPIFNRGRMNGGFVENSHNDRIKPFASLASRTVGFQREVSKEDKKGHETIRRGIEHSYNKYLMGESKLIPIEHIKGVGWVKSYDATGTPKRGYDIKTTLNIQLQDIAEKALSKQLIKHQATKGTAVVMEVETGQVKAMVNLKVKADGNSCVEAENYAVKDAYAPGSTLKVATLMALLQETPVKLDELVHVGDGVKKYYDHVLRDSSKPKHPYMSLQQVIEKSSNVGTAEFAMKYFGDVKGGDRRFRSKFDDFGLTQKTGIDLSGEAPPFIRKYGEKNGWSGISVPWLSIGYEANLTPLQTLAFYNAIANKGKYMRPYLVSEIYDGNKVIESFKPQVLREICDEQTAETVTNVLKGVVNNGTAKSLQLPNLQIAGKTGTAKDNEELEGFQHRYLASFAGFFPADNPKYSCIVFVCHPKKEGYYGATVAGPVFKEIAEKFYLNLETPTIVFSEFEQNNEIILDPECKVAYTKDLQDVLTYVGVPYGVETNSDWVVSQNHSNGLQLRGREFLKDLVPNVRGMGLKDAIYVLENYGLNVAFENYGKVVSQSMSPGSRFVPGDEIKIILQ